MLVLIEKGYFTFFILLIPLPNFVHFPHKCNKRFSFCDIAVKNSFYEVVLNDKRVRHQYMTRCCLLNNNNIVTKMTTNRTFGFLDTATSYFDYSFRPTVIEHVTDVRK